MNSRILLLLSALFWLTMNFLLWRSEFGGRNQLGNAVPTELVWRKIITAPDESTLDVFHHGKKTGYCRWTAAAGQIAIPGDDPDDLPPERTAKKTPGYRLDANGNVTLGDVKNRLLFNVELKLETNRAWREFNLRLNVRDTGLAIHTVAAEQSVRLRTEDAGEKLERTLTFAELRDPRALARAFELPLPLEFLGLGNLTTNTPGNGLPDAGLAWEARNDWITVGHASVRVFRLGAKLLDRYQVAIFVSPVGEILRVELPDDWLLVNDQAGNL